MFKAIFTGPSEAQREVMAREEAKEREFSAWLYERERTLSEAKAKYDEIMRKHGLL